MKNLFLGTAILLSFMFAPFVASAYGGSQQLDSTAIVADIGYGYETGNYTCSENTIVASTTIKLLFTDTFGVGGTPSDQWNISFQLRNGGADPVLAEAYTNISGAQWGVPYDFVMTGFFRGRTAIGQPFTPMTEWNCFTDFSIRLLTQQFNDPFGGTVEILGDSVGGNEFIIINSGTQTIPPVVPEFTRLGTGFYFFGETNDNATDQTTDQLATAVQTNMNSGVWTTALLALSVYLVFTVMQKVISMFGYAYRRKKRGEID